MAFSHGTLAKLFANGYDLSGWLKEIQSSGTATAEDATTLNKFSKVYSPGLADATLRFDGLYDGVAAAIDEILQAALAGAAVLTWLPVGDVFGSVGYGLEAVSTGYDVPAPVAGLVKITGMAQSKVGRERGVILHLLARRQTTGNGTAIDNTAESLNGAAAYLQVTANSGLAATIKVQHSTNNTDWVDLITFTVADTDTILAVRTAVTGTIARYARATWATTALDCTFELLFCRK
jgi:hypothetical protein